MSLRSLPEGYQPGKSPSMYLEGYITFRQYLDGDTDEPAILRGENTYGIGADLESIVETGDSLKKAALLAIPLGSAVSIGTTILKAGGEQSLATSALFREKLQVFLRDEYESAVEVVIQDNVNIPPFPLENRRLLSALMRGSRSRLAVEQVHRMLRSEARARV